MAAIARIQTDRRLKSSMVLKVGTSQRPHRTNSISTAGGLEQVLSISGSRLSKFPCWGAAANEELVARPPLIWPAYLIAGSIVLAPLIARHLLARSLDCHSTLAADIAGAGEGPLEDTRDKASLGAGRGIVVPDLVPCTSARRRAERTSRCRMPMASSQGGYVYSILPAFLCCPCCHATRIWRPSGSIRTLN